MTTVTSKALTSHEGLVALTTILLTFAILVISLRFYSRKIQKAPYKADDWIMIPCLILLMGTCGCMFYGVGKKVLGYPTPADTAVAAATAPTLSKVLISIDIFQYVTLGCIKASALLFYHRIFCASGRHSIFRGLIIGTIVISILWTIAYTLLAGLQCGTHFSALWTSKADKLKYCHVSYPFLLSFAISDFLLDLWVLTLPIPKIWGIKSSIQRRLSILGVFALAFVGFGACIARLAVTVQLEKGGPGSLLDTRLANTKLMYFAIMESGLSCIAVNLPSLWFLVSKVTPENVLRSVRSMISLASIHSQNSRGKTNTKASDYPPTSPNESGETSSLSHLARSDTNAIETHAMYDLEAKPTTVPFGMEDRDVQVTKSFSQISNRVA